MLLSLCGHVTSVGHMHYSLEIFKILFFKFKENCVRYKKNLYSTDIKLLKEDEKKVYNVKAMKIANFDILNIIQFWSIYTEKRQG